MRLLLFLSQSFIQVRCLDALRELRAKIGTLNPKVEQSLLTMISTLIAQSIAVIEKNKINPTPIGLRLANKKVSRRVHVVGNSKQLQSIFEMIRQVSASSAVVSLHGELSVKGICQMYSC